MQASGPLHQCVLSRDNSSHGARPAGGQTSRQDSGDTIAALCLPAGHLRHRAPGTLPAGHLHRAPGSLTAGHRRHRAPSTLPAGHLHTAPGTLPAGHLHRTPGTLPAGHLRHRTPGTLPAGHLRHRTPSPCAFHQQLRGTEESLLPLFTLSPIDSFPLTPPLTLPLTLSH